MQRSTTGKFGRFIKRIIIGALALTLMAAGVAGFLIFTLTGNAWQIFFKVFGFYPFPRFIGMLPTKILNY